VQEVEEDPLPHSGEGVHLEGVLILDPVVAVAADHQEEVPSALILHLLEVPPRRGGLPHGHSAGAAAEAGHLAEVVQGQSQNKQRNLIN